MQHARGASHDFPGTYSRLPAHCLLGPGPAQLLPFHPCLRSLLLPVLGALTEESLFLCSTATFLPGGALWCLRRGKVVTVLPWAGSTHLHWHLLPTPSIPPRGACNFLRSRIPCVVGLWAQGKGRLTSLHPWGPVFSFCSPGTWSSEATKERSRAAFL